MTFKHTLIALSIGASLALSGCGDDDTIVPDGGSSFTQVKDLPVAEKKAVIKTALTAYADYAIDNYKKAKEGAEKLRTAIDAFTATPTDVTLKAAKVAWLASRESYGITETIRFQDTPIDAEGDSFGATFGAPEGQLNAWPLNESMVDNIVDALASGSTNNIVNNPDEVFGTFTGQDGTDVSLGEAGDQVIDTTTITIDMLREFTEKDGDANVATGYHAVEFLLWGQDQDYVSFVADEITPGALVAGERAVTDYTTDTGAERRKTFLKVSTDLIIADLDSMIKAWTTGGYKEAFIGEGAKAMSQDDVLKNVFSGMGVFIKSEVANERLAVATLLPSEEDEHSCFSDNTHRDLTLNYDGFMNLLNIFKVNLSPVGKVEITVLDTKIDAKMVKINYAAENDEHFDYQIMEGSANKQNVKDIVHDLRDIGDHMVKVAAEYGVELTVEDVTDPDESEEGTTLD